MLTGRLKMYTFMKRISLIIILLGFMSLSIWGDDGDIFTSKSIEGVEMTFKVISESDKTCQVGQIDSTWGTNSCLVDKNYDGVITIPEDVNGYHVVRVGISAFNQSKIKKVIIPKDVNTLLLDAFNCCYNLESIILPENLITINNYAFNYCTALKSIEIPQFVETIGEAAFRACSSLESIVVLESNKYYDSRDNCNAIIETASNKLRFGCKNTIIPNSISIIGKYSFSQYDETKTCEIPNSVNSIEPEAFENCKGLVSLRVPKSVTEIGNMAFYGCSDLIYVDSKIEEPFQITDNTFKGISEDAKLQIPQGTKAKYESFVGWMKFFKAITEEGDVTTYNMSIKSLGNGSVIYNETEIRNTSIVFTVNEGSSPAIQIKPDNGCKLVSVKKDDENVTTEVLNNIYRVNNLNNSTNVSVIFAKDASNISFADEKVKSICIANWDTNHDGELSEEEAANVENIGIVFNHTDIETFKEFCYFTGLSSIPSSAFDNCKNLVSITIPANVKTIGGRAFFNCISLETISFPNGVLSIGANCFDKCVKLKDFDYPDQLQTIGDGAFRYCNSLTNIDLPNSLKSMDYRAFTGCI